MLKIKELGYKYDEFELESVNLDLQPSYVLGVLGSNGAGKSTLIGLIAHELERQNGDVLLNGERDYRHTMAYAPSYFPFRLSYKIKELSKMMSLFYEEWDQEAFNLYCIKYDLDKNDKLKKLSLGMKQRLMIAITLSHKAKLVILDEVTEGIDPFVRDEIMNDLREFIYKYRPIVIVASHNLEQYESFIDHVLYLEEGKVLANENIFKFKEIANELLKEKLDHVTLSSFSLARQKEQSNVGN